MDGKKERWVDKLAWLDRRVDTRWMMCGHGYIWVVTLHITVAFPCRLSGRDKSTTSGQGDV